MLDNMEQVIAISEDGQKVILRYYINGELFIEIFDLIQRKILYRCIASKFGEEFITYSQNFEYVLIPIKEQGYTLIDIKNNKAIPAKNGIISPNGSQLATIVHNENDAIMKIYSVTSDNPEEWQPIESIYLGEDEVILSQGHKSNKILYYTVNSSYYYDLNTTLKQYTINHFAEGNKISLVDDWIYIYFAYPDSVIIDATWRYNIITDEIEFITERN